MRRAIDLVTKGFPIPVPFLENHSPIGRATVRVFNTFPEIARRGSYLYMFTLSGDVFMDPEIAFQPGEFYHSPGPMPATLQECFNGKFGEPAGPDVNEVSGRSLQEFIADRPNWQKLVPPNVIGKKAVWHQY